MVLGKLILQDKMMMVKSVLVTTWVDIYLLNLAEERIKHNHVAVLL